MQNNNYNEYQTTYTDINECTSRGACSISPTISSLQELAMLFLKQLAHYILQLEELGASNKNIKYEIITALASLVSINEFSENQLYSIVMKEYYLLEDTKKTYKILCNKENLISRELKPVQKFNTTTTISEAIALGEKIFLKKYKRRSREEKNLIEILQIIIKSVSLNMIKLNDFNEFDEEIYHQILETLNTFNNKNITCDEILTKISKLAEMDHKLQLRISEVLLKSFNGINKIKVSHSTQKGKAILVSGNNFFDLLDVLNATKDKNIDIYTHSNLLITHALKKFQEYKHLKGHYGDTTENCILDFATFPGSILLTKNSRNNTEYLYRGRLFSNDYIVPDGVIKIENNDYSTLINTAVISKGFSKGKTKAETNLGYNEEEINSKFEEIITKLNNNEIEKLYIIGIDAHLIAQKEYFNEMFENLKQNEFVISFGYESNKSNIMTINTGNYIPLVSNILKKLFAKYPISSEKITFFFTTCDVMTISSIVTLKDNNAKNIYMAKCPPTLVNPSVYETLIKKYNIHTTSSADKDLQKIR